MEKQIRKTGKGAQLNNSGKPTPRVSEATRRRFKKQDQAKGRRQLFGK